MGTREMGTLAPILVSKRETQWTMTDTAIRDWVWDLCDKVVAQFDTVSQSLYYRVRLGMGDRRGGARAAWLITENRCRAFTSSLLVDPDEELKGDTAIVRTQLELLAMLILFLVAQTVGCLILRFLLPPMYPGSALALCCTATYFLSGLALGETSLLGPAPFPSMLVGSVLLGLLFGGVGGGSEGAISLALLPLSQLLAFALLSGILQPQVWPLVGSATALVAFYSQLYGLVRSGAVEMEGWGVGAAMLLTVLSFDVRHRWALAQGFEHGLPSAFLFAGLLYTDAAARALLL